MIDRSQMRFKLYRALQTEYVALLGQRGIGVKTIINMIVNENAPYSSMKFISVALPRGMRQGDEFKELFLLRLIEASSQVPPGGDLAHSVLQAIQESSTKTVDFRLRRVLDCLGKGTSANHLIIVLHALAEVAEEPLKNLLLLLREYHDQMNYRGESGEKLRFLVAGDARLWKLCYHKTDNLSPFNIALRIFLGGLSLEEIQLMDKKEDFEASVKLRDLTDGVPSLVEQAINGSDKSDDLSKFFRYLQNHWSTLPVASQETLKKLAVGTENFPHCVRDYNCPEIPVVDSPWMEAFWGGFLRMRHYELAWRSPIHQAFVLEQLPVQSTSSKFMIMKVDLVDRANRLEKALKNTQYSRDWDENIEEALSLAVQINDTELTSLLQMIQSGEREDTILKKVEQLVEKPERSWIRELGKQTEQNKVNISSLLIESVIWDVKRSLGDFDVFLCHNNKDKPKVKEIGLRLKERGILSWLDEWELRPGFPWQRSLEQQIERIKTAAVFVGDDGIGPWQQEELEAFLREFTKRGCPVIPVLLPNSSTEPKLPPFLSSRTWVDFRKQVPNPIDQLVWGITGKHSNIT